MSQELVLKTVYDLLGGHFYIPYYQRGYRWTDKQVDDLLSDLWGFAKKRDKKDEEFYCLQPVVVKEAVEEERYEVIDGQQRLTTLYLIIQYLMKEYLRVDSLKGEYGKPVYEITYETREDSGEFLKDVKEDHSNIDFHYIHKAYERIRSWFENGEHIKTRNDRDLFLRTLMGRGIVDENNYDPYSVKVIWYEVDQDADSKALFTRLNIGKIPLTNAELIKALFLSSSSFNHVDEVTATNNKLEISIFWDEIEKKLSEPEFWSFITNEHQEDYANRIELIFNMMAGKSIKDFDPLYTFLYFLEQSKDSGEALWALWLKIERYYHLLLEWYKDLNLYHKIGYLVSIDEPLKDLIKNSLEMRKDDFEKMLDQKIKESVNFNIRELSYDERGGYNNIKRVLTLFNVESIRQNPSIQSRYPFQFYKNTHWSIEHIHAQNTEGMDQTKKEPWLQWLEYHKSILKELLEPAKGDNKIRLAALIEEAEKLQEETITWNEFTILSESIIDVFSEEIEGDPMEAHGISNLALLSQPDNSALNNSVFEVKRRAIIEMDRSGNYIPLCTRWVFLKYYNPVTSNEQFYFWNQWDRKNYLTEIERVLESYLPLEEVDEDE